MLYSKNDRQASPSHLNIFWPVDIPWHTMDIPRHTMTYHDMPENTSWNRWVRRNSIKSSVWNSEHIHTESMLDHISLGCSIYQIYIQVTSCNPCGATPKWDHFYHPLSFGLKKLHLCVRCYRVLEHCIRWHFFVHWEHRTCNTCCTHVFLMSDWCHVYIYTVHVVYIYIYRYVLYSLWYDSVFWE